MRLILLPALFAMFVVPVLGDDKADADLKAMVGKWKLEKGEIGGKDASGMLKDLKFEIEGPGKYVTRLGEDKDEGTFTVDPGKTPKEIDVTSTGGVNKGKTIKGIYKLEGDVMTICYEHGTGDRPTKFETKPDSKQFLAVYKRLKK